MTYLKNNTDYRSASLVRKFVEFCWLLPLMKAGFYVVIFTAFLNGILAFWNEMEYRVFKKVTGMLMSVFHSGNIR